MKAEFIPMALLPLQLYVPASLRPRDDMVMDEELLVELDWETRTLPFGEVQVMLGTGRPSKVQFNCTL